MDRFLTSLFHQESVRRFFLFKLLFLIFTNMCLFCSSALAQTASFTPSASTSCLPAVINFTDNSIGATTWFWTFGNSNTSNAQNPTATYVVPGLYTVTLTINKGTATEKSTSSNISVFPSPSPSITPVKGCEPFTGSLIVSAPPQSAGGLTGGNPVSYTWNFAGALPTVTQNNPVLNLTNVPTGNYNVLLTVSDDNGCSKSAFFSNILVVDPQPVADFTITKTDLCNPSLVNFTNSSTIKSGSIGSYAWDIGNDGTIESTSKDFSYTYSTTGSFDVALTVTSANGCVSNKTVKKVIFNPNNSLDFSSAGSCVGDSVKFTDLSSATAIAWGWDYNNDGVVDSNKKNSGYVFGTTGLKTVKLTVTFDDGCVKSITKNIMITGATSSFTYDMSAACAPTYTIAFASTSTASGGKTVTAYAWDFNNDGVTDNTIPTPTFNFNSPGTYKVKLTVTSSDGCTNSSTQDITIASSALGFVSTLQTGCVPLSTKFSPTYSNLSDPIVTYSWDFGDPVSGVNNSSNLKSPTHVYNNSGKYDVVLTATTSRGCVLTQSIPKMIMTGAPPVISNVTYTQVDLCQKNPVQFIATIPKTVDMLIWDFGDGATQTTNPNNATADTVTHKYVQAGSMTVKVQAFSNGCQSLNDKILAGVVINEPIAIMTASPTFDCVTPSQAISFANTTLKNTTNKKWDWDFGDGDHSTAFQPTHSYKVAGDYKVKLRVTDTITTCVSDTVTSVYITTCDPKFVVDNATPCANDSVTFTNQIAANSSPNCVISSYTWDFGDGTPPSNKPNPKHAYTVPGLYSVRLVVTESHGCSYTKIMNNLVDVRGPIVDFKQDQGQICAGSTVQFTDLTTKAANDPVDISQNKFLWNFGDGNTSVLQNPTHTFQTSGTYTVQLQVTDANGCKATKSVLNSVQVPTISAKFSTLSSIYCLDTLTAIAFTSTSVGTISQYDWDLDGDGVYEVLNGAPTQNKIYKSIGTFNTKLKITSNLGCTDVVSKIIQIVDGKAGIKLLNPALGCAPITAQLKATDSAAFVSSYLWDFGDGVTSNIAAPNHDYLRPGDYTITLKEVLTGGCTKQSSIKVHISGAYGVLKYTNASGCAPNNVTFTADSLSSAQSVTWDFGDGTPTVVQQVGKGVSSVSTSHTYNSFGSKLPIMILHDSICGDYPIYDLNKRINVSQSPNVSFVTDATAKKVCLGNAVNFSDKSVAVDTRSTVSTWDWDFGDGSTHSTSKNPSHTYPATGTYIVTLVAGNAFVAGGCNTSFQDTIIVDPIPDVKVSVSNQNVLSAIPISSIVITGSVQGSSFSWTRNSPLGLTTSTPSSGTVSSSGGQIDATFINTTKSPITVIYTITPQGPVPTNCVGSSVTSQVIVSPNAKGIAINDTIKVKENLDFNGDVSRNDTPSSDGGNKWSVAQNPSHGTLLLNADGTFTYSPDFNYSGNDSFKYTLEDINKDTVSAVVLITVVPLPKISKTCSVPRAQSDGKFAFSYTILVDNQSNEQIDSVQVIDNLDDVFKSTGCTYQVVSLTASGVLTANPNYDGSNVVITLLPGMKMAPHSKDSISIQLLVDPHSKDVSITVFNQATLQCKASIGQLSLLSDANISTKATEPTAIVIPKTELIIPDAFTPNQDNVNDNFEIVKPLSVTLAIEIYNRWGVLVYKNDDYQNDWDGKGVGSFANQDLPSGTYFCTYKTIDIATGQTHEAGVKYITLRR